MENLLSLPKMSKSEQIEHVKLARQGDKEAKNRLVMSCSGLVKQKIMQLVSENTWCYPQLNLIYDDLLSSGLLGVVYAFEKFDISKNSSFSSYAFFWIDAFLRKQFAIMRKTHYSQDELDENVTYDESETMFESAYSKILCRQLLGVVGTLEREIIVLFFGLNCRRHTLKEIAGKYGFSFQYAGKVKQRALQKMRNYYSCALQCA